MYFSPVELCLGCFSAFGGLPILFVLSVLNACLNVMSCFCNASLMLIPALKSFWKSTIVINSSPLWDVALFCGICSQSLVPC